MFTHVRLLVLTRGRMCVKLYEVCGSNYSSQFRKVAHVKFYGCTILEPISTDLSHGLDLWAGRSVLRVIVHSLTTHVHTKAYKGRK